MTEPRASIAFRTAAAADVPAIVALVESAYRGESGLRGWTTESHLLDGQRTDAADVGALIARPDSCVLLAFRDGALVACLEQDAPDDRGHYLCYLSRQQLPKRIRAFIDFMTTSIRALDLCGIELTAQRIHLPAAADAAGVPA